VRAYLIRDRDHLAQDLQQLDAQLVLLFVAEVERVADDSFERWLGLVMRARGSGPWGGGGRYLLANEVLVLGLLAEGGVGGEDGGGRVEDVDEHEHLGLHLRVAFWRKEELAGKMEAGVWRTSTSTSISACIFESKPSSSMATASWKASLTMRVSCLASRLAARPGMCREEKEAPMIGVVVAGSWWAARRLVAGIRFRLKLEGSAEGRLAWRARLGGCGSERPMWSRSESSGRARGMSEQPGGEERQ